MQKIVCDSVYEINKTTFETTLWLKGQKGVLKNKVVHVSHILNKSEQKKMTDGF